MIGDWGNAWEDACQEIIDGIIEHADQFSHIERLFVGDMDYECCEVSWIMQGDYSRLWAAMPQLKALTVKGSTDLVLGKISHENLEELTIICGGLPEDVLMSIQEAHLRSFGSCCSIWGSNPMVLTETRTGSARFFRRRISRTSIIWASRTARFRMRWSKRCWGAGI